MKYFRKVKAFTLAEVLITLAIIGVVAALTIPVLISNYQKKEYVTALKKAYTQINQALVELTHDAGCLNNIKCTELFASADGAAFAKEFVKYFQVSKDCQTGTGCFSPDTYHWYYDRTADRYDINALTYYYKFITSDGTSIAVFSLAGYWGNCAASTSKGNTNALKQLCGSIMVDVNGLKPPNTFGRDTFAFFLTNSNLYPYGGTDSNGNGSGRGASYKNADGSLALCYPGNPEASSCAGRVIDEGWVMNY